MSWIKQGDSLWVKLKVRQVKIDFEGGINVVFENKDGDTIQVNNARNQIIDGDLEAEFVSLDSIINEIRRRHPGVVLTFNPPNQ